METEQGLARLHQAIEYLKDIGKIHKDKDIVDTLGMNKGNISRAIAGNTRYFTSGFLRRFAAAYSDYISEEWLLNGQGRMQVADRANTRPHIPADRAMVAAGPMGVAIGSVTEEECEPMPIVRRLPAYDFTIEVQGKSMEPTLQDGDVIACAWLDRGAEFNPAKIYVLDTAEGGVVKRVRDNGDSLLCHSDNPAFADYPIAKTPDIRPALVVGIVLREL